MDREEVKSRYKQLLSRMVGLKMYYGCEKIDVYVCGCCGRSVLTTYRNKGVTPFIIRCPFCKSANMRHNLTLLRKDFSGKQKVLEWYRPSFNELIKMSNGAIEHVLFGGLILKR